MTTIERAKVDHNHHDHLFLLPGFQSTLPNPPIDIALMSIKRWILKVTIHTKSHLEMVIRKKWMRHSPAQFTASHTAGRAH